MERVKRRRSVCTALALAGVLLLSSARVAGAAQEYEILAVRYATIEGFALRGLLPDAPRGETLDIAMAVWVIRGHGRVVLFDSGFFRESWLTRFDVRGYVGPDAVLARIGIRPEDVTDIVVSHAHWDHMGGIALFPRATIWIQEAEYAYYTGAAWQAGGNSGGIDRADIEHLEARRMAGSVRLVAGDSVEILPGLTVFTGARHTFASQYLLVESPERYVLASDNAYLYRGIVERRASATFAPDDRAGNIAAIARMIRLAGDAERVIPGHDAAVFTRFPALAEGVVRITPVR